MNLDHYQEEETYLFLSILAHLRNFPQRNHSLNTKCLLATFWRIYGGKELFQPFLEYVSQCQEDTAGDKIYHD